MEEPLQDFHGSPLRKTVYVAVFEEGIHLRDKVTKICDSFHDKRFHLPDDGHGDKKSFARKIDSLRKKVDETRQIISVTRRQMRLYLEGINQEQGVAFSLFEVYRLFIRREKAIHEVLNMV